MAYRSGFFPNRRGAHLFYAEETADAAAPDSHAWIICPPILEEHTVAHDIFRRLAVTLAGRGQHVFRFDYEGHGDSDGDTTAVGLREWAHDVEDAAAMLRQEGRTHIGLLGCRVGAIIAALSASAIHAHQLIAWCPVLNGQEHAQDLLRLNLTAQLTVHKRVIENRERLAQRLEAGESVNILGWEIGGELYRSLRESEFDAIAQGAGCRVDVVPLSGVQFWEDPRLIDTEQAALTQKTIELIAGGAP